jgi:hypothetical protein
MTQKKVYPTIINLQKNWSKILASYMNVKNQEMQIDYWKENQQPKFDKEDIEEKSTTNPLYEDDIENEL